LLGSLRVRLRRVGVAAYAAGSVLAVLLIAPASAPAAAGELDVGFGLNGRLTQNIDFNVVPSTDTARDVAIQPDGRIVVAGSTFVSNESSITNAGFAVLRLTAAGVPDGSSGGSFSVFSEGSPPNNGATGVALQPDGQILLAGSNGQMGSDFTADRISGATGNFDATFGPPNGWSTLDFAGVDGADVGTDSPLDMALQSDGAIVMAGYSDAQFAVGRVSSIGSPDNGFDGNGRKRVDFTGTFDYATSVALSGSKIIAAGYAGDSPNHVFAVLSLNSNGTPDTGFGGGSGQATNGIGEIPHGAEAIAVQPDGKILLAGPAGGDFGVARVKTDGLYDPGFGADGQVSVDLGGKDIPHAIALQPDGKILVAGTDGDGFAVTRLMADGSVDSGFGIGGRATVNFGGVDEALGMALQPDGKVVLVGTNGSDYAVTRLLGDPVQTDEPAPGPAAASAKCRGRKATIVGTRRRDRLSGTGAADVIAGLGGADTISGLGRNDTICGGRGNDKLKGGPGRDRLLGGPGKDTLLGGPGKDILLGGPGRDRLNGGPGKDTEKS
jgi:uncharacterized delta-60 repeat protein